MHPLRMDVVGSTQPSEYDSGALCLGAQGPEEDLIAKTSLSRFPAGQRLGVRA
jgi:hypothetical protein